MEEFIKSTVLEIGCTSGAIMIVDKDAGILRCGASYNMPKAWDDLTNKLENNPSNTNGTVAVTGKYQVHNAKPVMFHGYPIYSWLVVPIIRDGDVIANLEMVDSDKYEFTIEDVEIVKQRAIDFETSGLI